MNFIVGKKCNDILVESSSITTMIADHNNYLSAKVTLTNNCCGTSYTNTTTQLNPILNPISTHPITIVTDIAISTITIQNTSTGELVIIDLSGASLPLVDCTDTPAITSAINDYMTANYSGESFSGSCSLVGSDLTYTLESNTGNWIAYSISYTIPAITTPITVLFIQPIIYITPLGIVINPSIITSNLTNFSDGVYSICILLTVKPDASAGTVQECGCIFVNCGTTCIVLNVAAKATDKDAIAMLMYLYGLENGTKCMCDCSYMCQLFLGLINLLNSYTTNNPNLLINNCGCS